MKRTLTAIALLAFSSDAVASLHQGYWRRSTPQGQVFLCRGVDSQSSMEAVLRSAGWPMARVPKIDWSSETAVIISPKNFYKDREIQFVELKSEGGNLILEYGYRGLESAQVGANSATFGSTGEGQAETIVVSYQRSLEVGLGFVCRNRGKV
jgi:hypothetical protein